MAAACFTTGAGGNPLAHQVHGDDTAMCFSQTVLEEGQAEAWGPGLAGDSREIREPQQILLRSRTRNQLGGALVMEEIESTSATHGGASAVADHGSERKWGSPGVQDTMD